MKNHISRIAGCMLLSAGLLFGSSAFATPITTNGQWYEFLFGGTGSSATACGGRCQSGVNSIDVGLPSWTFSGPTVFSVTDGFAIGDVFEIFDNSISLGLTSAAGVGPSACAVNDPACMLSEGVFSSRSYLLGGGDHSITIRASSSPFGAGAAFFSASANPASVPEPSSLMLFVLGLACLGFARHVSRKNLQIA